MTRTTETAVITTGEPVRRESIGFIGLGMMGAPMAEVLASDGWPLTIFDLDRSKAQSVADRIRTSGRCGLAGCLADLADATLLVTMLPNSDIVDEVLLTPELTDPLAPGALVVDMSSSVPERTIRLGRELRRRGLSLVDAPVSGGVAKARTAQLTVMAGGRESDVRRARPVLESMASTVFHVGPLGAGHATKALNNVLSASGLLLAVEATEAARRFGIAPEVFLDVVNQSTGRNHATENKVARYVLSESYDSGFSAQLMMKDLRIAQTVAEATRTPANLLDAVAGSWAAAIADLPKGADQTEVARFVLARGRGESSSGVHHELHEEPHQKATT